MNVNIYRPIASKINPWRSGKMKYRLIPPILLPLFALTACGGGDTESGGLSTLIIVLTSSCNGRVGSVEIFVDDALVADLTPGRSTSRLVTMGNHTIEGIGDNGLQFGPTEVNVDVDTFTQNLNCR